MMRAQLANPPEGLKVITFRPTFEIIHGMLAEHYLYLFDKTGALIEGEAVRQGKAKIALTDSELEGAHIILGPCLDHLLSNPANLSKAKLCHVYEPEWVYEPGRLDYVLAPVPEKIWRWWLAHSLWRALKRKTRFGDFFAM
jgi:hypothetical protein